MVADRQGKCVNIGNCSLADKREPIITKAGQDFVCPECGKGLVVATPGGSSNPSRRNALIVSGILAVIVVVAGGLTLRGCKGEAPVTNGGVATGSVASGTGNAAPPPANPPPSAAGAASPLIRLGGSNTIGARLGPALAAGYLKELGCGDVKSSTIAVEEVVVSCEANGKPLAIAISAHGSATAFTGLEEGAIDVGMASRKITSPEVDRLRALGDMTSPANEHVLGLDGIAVIVHQGNRMSKLTVDQIAAIFTGVVTDWKQVGGTGGKINVYARDDKSGTFDTFKALIIGKTPLVAGTKRFEDGAQLSAEVANDPDGIGFVGLSAIGSAKAVAVGPPGAAPLLPNRFTVATEDYALSRRLFLYTAQSSARPDAARFIAFAKSGKGQAIVEQSGAVALTIRQETSAAPAGAPSAYNGLVANALRLSVNFRFRTGSADLDNRALQDLDNIATFLVSSSVTPDRLMLFGFTDSRGTAASNQTLSENRARTVGDALRQRGIDPKTVRGFGAAIPIADNATPEGQDKNRRVEAWISR